MAVYGYARVSTFEQAGGTSLEEQQRKIEGIALMRGLELARMFQEPAVSGSLPLEDRPAGGELYRTLRAGDTLVVAKLDRAFRNAADALAKADAWKRAGIKLIVADMGADPVTDNGVAKLFFGMLALVAEFERERILERTNEGRRAKARRGGHVGGTAPFGYRVEGRGREARLVEVPEEQAAIRTILTLGGTASLRKIAEAAQERHGVRVSHEAVRRVLAESPRDPERRVSHQHSRLTS
jgi:DNA invertase Pin-like site-specific DNA recombinase